MFNSFAVQEKEQFYASHGDYVTTPEGPILFADGAQDENSMTGLGRLIPPPEDKWDRAKLIARYCQIVAELAEESFIDFKNYLQGTGRGVRGVVTPEEKLTHLKFLRQQAL